MNKYISADLITGLTFPSVRAGISLYPVSFLFFQPTIGVLRFSERGVDMPLFEPEYFYSLRGGVHFPFGTSQFAISLAYGKTTIVDNNYNPNGGFPALNSIPLPIRKEKRMEYGLSLGIIFKF